MASVSTRATDNVDGTGDPKRRKLRKGTHSCWACKRRKEKCVLCADDSAVCLGCRKRGTPCITQDQPEETIDHHLHAMAMVANDRTARAKGSSAPPSQTSPAAETVNAHAPASSSQLYDHPASMADVSQALHAALPSPEECAVIYRASSRHSALFNGSTLTMPYTGLDPNGIEPSGAMPAPPSVKSHPVLMARHILGLVSLLQDLHPNVHHELDGLREPPRAMAERLAELAIGLVTSQSRMLASVEGLECVVLESIYYGNCGNLRLSWMACRRAMLLGQLLGLHAPGTSKQYRALDHTSRCDPQYMWFRIIHYDRYMCLLLGLPQGSTDISMASEALLAQDTAMGRLERLQCVLASRILQRNESDPTTVDLSVTQNLDKDLQRAAQTLPSKWWLIPDLGNPAQTKSEVLWDVQRLYVQIFHFNLLNQLHVPYMFQSSTDPRFAYSKFACVNASREILSRFTVLRRSFQVAYNCRTIDYLAVMASVTLLLAHLDSYCHPSPGDIMTHLYIGDRGMMEQAQENLQEVSRLNDDLLSRNSADLLRRLLAIEAEAANGYAARAQSVVVQQLTPNSSPAETQEDPSQLHIPYFGLIKFALEGIATQATRYPDREIGHSDMKSQMPARLSAVHFNTTTHPFASSSSQGFGESGTTPSTQASGERQSLVPPTSQHSAEMNTQQPAEGPTTGPAPVHDDVWNPKFSEGGFFDPLLPGLSGNNEWSLEGIDMAYFGRLMAGSV